MRDFYLFTKKPIVFAECKEKILAEVKKCRPYEGGGESGFQGERKNFWTFELENGGIFDDVENREEREDLLQMEASVPIENPYVNYFGCHRSIDLKRMLAVLVQIYPELYVNDDGDWYGTAQEYIDTEFDY